jgi:NAD+ diphosphatase
MLSQALLPADPVVYAEVAGTADIDRILESNPILQRGEKVEGESAMYEFQFCPRCAAPLVQRTLQGEVRSACSANCGYVHYDNPTPVVAAIVEHDGMVVLAHNRAWPERLRSFYGLITGFLERAESPEQCALREVKEELDLVGTAANLIGVYPFEQMNQVIIAYHVPAHGTVTLNHELDDYRHVPLRECTAWPSGTGLALRDWLRSKGFEPPILDMPTAKT